MVSSTVADTRLGATPIAGDFGQAVPSVTVTGPSGAASTNPFNVTWTYDSPVARAQAKYRVRILAQDGSTVIYDSSIVDGAGTTAATTVILSSGSSYFAAVAAFDGFDWSAEDTLGFIYDGDDLEDVVPLATVGTIHEIGINGRGYMLYDHPDKPEMRYTRRVIPLESPRQATGDTPFSEAIDRYTMIGFSEWADGAGQRFYKRANSSDSAYYTSSGINPFTPGELRLLPATALYGADSYAFSKAVVASGKLFITTADGKLSAYDDPSDVTPTEFTITGAAAATDLASDGTYWYHVDGANIYRNNTGADPAGAWSIVDAKIIEWCTDRIAIARIGTGSTPNIIETLNYTTGAVSGPATGPAGYTFDPETDIRSITSGDGWMWWAAARFDKSVIYGQQLGSTDSFITALDLPAGQDVQSIGYYLGNVFVRAREQVDGTARKVIIYRCVASEGRLTPTKVLEISDAAVDHSYGDFAGDDRFVYFSWRAMNTVSGIGCIDLATGGYTKWLEAPANTGIVRSIVQWYGRTLFTIDGYGAVLEQVAVGAGDKTVATGSLTTSISDLNTGQRKGFGPVSATFDPLPTGSTITVAYSLDAGNSFTTLTPSVTAAGQKTASWDLDVESDSIMLRVTLTHTSTTTPVLRSLLVKARPMGLGDQILTVPINCADQVSGLNGSPIADQCGPGRGSRRLRVLEALSQTRVVVQDVDWRDTQTTYIFDVVAVEALRVGVMNRARAKQSNSWIATVTMRRQM